MKFDTGFTTSQSTFFLSAVPDDVADGYPPIDRLLLDVLIQEVSPGNQVVAGVLAFEQYIGQEVTIGKDIPRMVERAIQAFFDSRPVSAHRVTDAPSRVWPSAGTMYISEFEQYVKPPLTSPGSPHDYYVEVADGRVFNGALASAHQLIVASNAALISRLRSGTFAKDALLMAVGVLLARDLHVRNIHIESDEDARNLQRYRSLLRSIDINLSWGPRSASLVNPARNDGDARIA